MNERNIILYRKGIKDAHLIRDFNGSWGVACFLNGEHLAQFDFNNSDKKTAIEKVESFLNNQGV